MKDGVSLGLAKAESPCREVVPSQRPARAVPTWIGGVDRKGRCGGDADVCAVYRSLYWGGVRVHGSPGGANRQF